MSTIIALTGIKENSGATKWSKINIHNSKISANLDLPHSLVFIVLFSSLNLCVGNIKHIKTTENKLDLECMLRKRWAQFCISPQSPPRNVSILTAISKPCPSFTAVCEETSTVIPFFFFQLFAKNSLIKNIFQEEKSLIVQHDFFFLENSSVFGVFELMRGLQASPQPGNQIRSK